MLTDVAPLGLNLSSYINFAKSNFMKKFRATFDYIMRHKHVTVYGLLFASLITFGLIGASVWVDNYVWYADYVDPFATVATLLLAIILWFSNADRDRQRKLPLRLTASFKYQGREIARCEEAYLAGETDIRAWGQQIGAQMLRTRFLKMEPYINQTGPRLTTDKSTLKDYNLYTVCFYLKEKPDASAISKAPSPLKDEFLKKLDTQRVLWNPAEDEHGHPSVIESWIPSNLTS